MSHVFCAVSACYFSFGACSINKRSLITSVTVLAVYFLWTRTNIFVAVAVAYNYS
jgi:hypothetical protein